MAHKVTRAMLLQTAFTQRESGFSHATFDDEMALFYYMANGETEAMLEAMGRWRIEQTGKLSNDPLQNARYLYVSTVTVACRICIQRGLDITEAYNASDLYIQRMDACATIGQIEALRVDMMTYYSDRMRAALPQAAMSKPVVVAMDYVENRLHDRITLAEVAAHAGVGRTYLSTLFHRETGVPLSRYILRRRVEAAKNMLRYTGQTVAEIAEVLAFANPSHFHRVFRQETGMTPVAYRRSVGGLTEERTARRASPS